MTTNWPRCPKCKSQNVELIEIWDATISWLPDEPYFNGRDLSPGDPNHVYGHCLECGRRWRMRGIVQVRKEWFTQERMDDGNES